MSQESAVGGERRGRGVWSGLSPLAADPGLWIPASAAFLALLAACTPRVDRSWRQESGYRWRALVEARGTRAGGFTQLGASATGISHRNDVDDEHALANRNLLIGAGVALGDVDGDELPDVFLAAAEGPAALYHNAGGLKFADVTRESGLGAMTEGTIGAAFADLDGDGDLDLLAGSLGGPLRLLVNDGKGRFTDRTPSSGLDSGFAATTLTLADVDVDGDLDLYAATYKRRNALDAYSPQQRAFDQVVKRVGTRTEVLPQWRREYRIEDRPDLGGIVRSQRAEPDLFYLNDGHGRFERRPLARNPQFLDENGGQLLEEPDYFTLAARFYDFTGDGAPDLYVCNDFEDPDQIWVNDGRGRFRLIPRLAVRETSNTCMSVDFADVNRDGHVDIFTADMLSPRLADRQRQIPTHTPLPKPVGLTPDRAQWMRNVLLVARGDGTFAQAADYAGVSASDWTWGSAFVDVDLDGWDDLLAVNGHRWDIRDADTFDRIRNSFPRVPWNREQREFPRLAARSVAFRNQGDLTFSDASRAWGFGVDTAISHGIALADLDGDGDLDAVVTRLDAPAVVYRNDARAPRVAVRLKGRSANTAGIGALVTVRAASLPVQSREVTAGGYYLSGSEPLLAFAAGRDTALTIEVRWPGGAVSTVDARPNRVYEVQESGARESGVRESRSGRWTQGSASLFTNATALLGGHNHTDSLFDDFARQPLLPNRFSQLGPGVSWVDVDADGREDLIVGTGRGGTLAVLRNAGGRFVRTSFGAVARWDLTTVLPLPDGRGGMSLLIGQANYEAASLAEALAVPSVVSTPIRGSIASPPPPVVPSDTASVGPLALGDVNGDLRLDLFVGARVIAGAWPLPARSRLYLRGDIGRRKSDGRTAGTSSVRVPASSLIEDSTNAAALRALGIVSAALLTDLNGDGWPELVVAGEWGPVRVLQNQLGRFRDVTRESGLAERTSRWNGLSAGDFDGDGRLDLVVTSWGRNIPWHASYQRPYVLAVGNFGGSGLGLAFARRDSATGREMPLESFSRLGVAIPSVRERIATFAQYSGMSLDEVLGDAAKSAMRVGATTFDHTLLLNRGDRFEARALPGAAQLAPAFAPVVADFDGNGAEDLFLAQNFSPTEIGTTRFDAGAGLVLLGDGHGGFRPLSVRESGIAILGDQRGAAAADFDGDCRVDLAVSQNGAPTTLWRNAGGTPGIRVRLEGGADNPLGVGALVRVVSGSERGPVREIRAGSGYWSMDAATAVLALPPGASAIWVRWPGGQEQSVPIRPGQREIVVRKR